MNLSKLLSKGRLVPVVEMRTDGYYVTAYRRSSRSRKRGEFTLKNPRKLATEPKTQNAEPPTAAAAAGGAT